MFLDIRTFMYVDQEVLNNAKNHKTLVALLVLSHQVHQGMHVEHLLHQCIEEAGVALVHDATLVCAAKRCHDCFAK